MAARAATGTDAILICAPLWAGVFTAISSYITLSGRQAAADGRFGQVRRQNCQEISLDPLRAVPQAISVMRFTRIRALLGGSIAVPRWVSVAFLAIDLALVVACVVALRQNLTLRRDLSVAVEAVTPKLYRYAPPLVGADLHGQSVAIRYRQDWRPTLVFSFSDGCPYCKAYWQAIKRLRPLAPRRLRLIYVDTTDGPTLRPAYLARNGVGGAPVLVRLTPLSALAYKARILPQAELLDGSGRIEWAHAGDLTPSDRGAMVSAIEQYMPKN